MSSPAEGTLEAPTMGSSSNVNLSRIERIASALGGSLLAAWSLRRVTAPRIVTAAAGAAVALRGLTGHSRVYERLGVDTSHPGTKAKALEIETAVTVHRPRKEVYQFWRELTNLPHFMPHLDEVKDMGDGRSTWTAHVPGGLGTISWEAEIIEDKSGKLLSWKSIPGADVHHAGTVRFKDAPGKRKGTEMHVAISYRPPGGNVGSLVTTFLNPINEQVLKEDIRRFKRLMETGEIPTAEGQPSGRR